MSGSTHTFWSSFTFRDFRAAFFLIVAVAIASGSLFAQSGDEDDAPPPLSQLSKDEKIKLNSETDVKDHTSLSLELMGQRLAAAESLNAGGHFDEMFKELGGFNAVVDNAINFLTKQDRDQGKVLNNFKKLEIGLRSFLPRLETIRRDLPSKYEPYLKFLIKFTRDAREKAVAPLFGDTVVEGNSDH